MIRSIHLWLQHIYKITQMADKKSVVPLYIYQGAQEFWIPPAGTRNLFAQQCRLGANVTYREVPRRTLPGDGHRISLTPSPGSTTAYRANPPPTTADGGEAGFQRRSVARTGGATPHDRASATGLALGQTLGASARRRV